MTNKEIASVFNNLGKIMELHGENKFKVGSYSNAYVQFRKVDGHIWDMSPEEILAIRGVGKAISDKVQELKSTGTIQTYEGYLAKTPPGVVKMLQIKGFGPKKIGTIWKDMGIETLGELLYACNENRLIELKGFGAKTQEQLKKSVEYFLQSEHKFRYADVADIAEELKDALSGALNGRVDTIGPLHRKDNVIECLEFIADGSSTDLSISDLDLTAIESGVFEGTYKELYPVSLRYAPVDFEVLHFEATYDDGLRSLGNTESEVLKKIGKAALAPEMKGLTPDHFEMVAGLGEELIKEEDIKGVVHAHSTYSDGVHTLQEMAEGAQKKGYEYLVITDHSKSAFYANGLKEEALYKQWAEIDALNSKMDGFHVFKSIESDILSDGSLDYEDDILEQFDMIIASVHSNLKMDIDKATTRLIKAIENPFTTMLGHPTGRLILSRLGYPIDHQRIIDACAANNVAIEINANPFRLDLDWEWIPYAMSKDVLISINPDAHSVNGIDHIKWGVISARKGGLSVKHCVNARNLQNFQRFLQTSKD